MADLPNLDDIDISPIHEAPVIQSKYQPKERKKKKRVSTRKSEACKKLNAALQAKGFKGALHENNASNVEKCIIAYIKLMDKCTAWKVGVKGTPRKNRNGETIMTSSGDTVGVSDVHALIQGRYLAIEVKFSKGDRQSNAQIKWQKRVEDSGGTYIIVRNFTDFLPKFREWFNNEILNKSKQLTLKLK